MEMADLMIMAFKSPEELNEMFDSGMFNGILKGYLILAMRENHTEAEIGAVLHALDETLGFVTAEEARAAWQESAF
jgi:hypothetical protein